MTSNLPENGRRLLLCHTFRLFYNVERGGFVLNKDLLSPNRFGEGLWFISPRHIYDGSGGLKPGGGTKCDGIVSVQCFQATLDSYSRLSTNLAVFSAQKLHADGQGGALKLNPYLWNRVNPATESDLLIVLTNAEGTSLTFGDDFDPEQCFLDLAMAQVAPPPPPTPFPPGVPFSG